MSERSSATGGGLDWLESKDFYELCQSYRHAQDIIAAAEGQPTAGEAFERLKLSIADAFAPSEIAPMPDHFEGPGTMAAALKPNERYLREALPAKYHDFYDKILLPLAQRGAESMRPSALSASVPTSDARTLLMLLDGFADDAPVEDVRAMLKRQFPEAA